MPTLDPETRASLNGDDLDHRLHVRFAEQRRYHFERQLRAHVRLNASARLAWLLTALSHRYGFAYMAVPRMSTELRVSTNTVRAGLHKLVALGLFEREDRTGPHRPNKYRRAQPPPGAVPDGVSDKAAFVRWVRRQRRLDLTVRTAWLLTDLCVHSGHAEISMAEIGEQLEAHENNVRAAVRRLLDLGLFVREPGAGRGHRNSYRPVGYVGEEQQPLGASTVYSQTADKSTTPHDLLSDDVPPAQFYEEFLKWQKQK